MHELFMSNVAAAAVVQGCRLLGPSDVMEIQQGDQVNLHSDAGTFQVIGVDGEHDRCWVRRWPMEPKLGSPVFEVSLQQISAVGLQIPKVGPRMS